MRPAVTELEIEVERLRTEVTKAVKEAKERESEAAKLAKATKTLESANRWRLR